MNSLETFDHCKERHFLTMGDAVRQEIADGNIEIIEQIAGFHRLMHDTMKMKHSHDANGEVSEYGETITVKGPTDLSQLK